MNSKEMYHLNDAERDFTKEEEIRVKKLLAEYTNPIRTDNKNKTCYTCGNKITSFCNSHSIPKFILKKIDNKEKVSTIFSMFNIPLFDKDLGAKKAGTFRIICNDCDNELFYDYENNNYISGEISQKILIQIAMKTFLKEIDKSMLNVLLFDKLSNNSDKLHQFYNKNSHNLILFNLNNYKKEFDYAKKHLNSSFNQNAYYMNYYKKLDYKVSLAFQGRIALISDFRDSIVNDLCDLSTPYKTSFLHIVVFPFSEYSIIILFTKDGDKKHRNFFKDLNKLSLNEQLQAILYLIFAYSEEVYIDQELIKNLTPKDYEILKNVAGKTFDGYVIDYKKRLFTARDEFSLHQYKNFPSLLDKDYLVNKISNKI